MREHFKNPLAWLVAVMAAFSAYCEVSLFVSFVGGDIHDQWLAGIFSGALVTGQFLLINQAVDKWQTGYFSLSVLSGVFASILLVISITGTVFYFEANFNNAANSELTTSDDYQQLTTLINSKQDSVNRFKDLADQETERGNKWQAGQHTKAANKAEIEVESLLSQRKKLSQKTTGAASTIGTELGDLRWYAWGMFGGVADLLPALAIILLTVGKTNTETASETEDKTDTEQPLFEIKPLLEQQEKTQAEPALTSLVALIRQLNEMPSWSTCKQKGITYTQYLKQRDQLQQAGVIEQNGQSWRLIKQPTQIQNV